jgi:acetoin utilization protein AcuB
MYVREWMTSPAIVITAALPVQAALELMNSRSVRRLPVIERGRLVGIVTRSDLHAVLGIERATRRGHGKTVADVMARAPESVSADDTLERAAQIMLRHKVSGLPVVDGDRVAGILTESDLFRALCALLGIDEPGARIAVHVPEAQNPLEAVSKRLRGLALQNLSVRRNGTMGRWEVVMRVRGRVPARVSRP